MSITSNDENEYGDDVVSYWAHVCGCSLIFLAVVSQKEPSCYGRQLGSQWKSGNPAFGTGFEEVFVATYVISMMSMVFNFEVVFVWQVQ